MSILLIAEHNNKEVKPFTFNAISAASQINEDVHVLVLGSNSDSVAKSISECPNVKKVTFVNGKDNQESLFSDLSERLRNIEISPAGFIYLLTDGPGGKLIKVLPKQ